jgi:glycosyltransferase involved in cell wall biosynthesis
VPEKTIGGGRRFAGSITPSLPGGQVVTVIVATLNAVESFAEMIQSMRNQSYQNFELIVIDGRSTDGTIEILAEHDKDIDYWLSERDTGVYEAWNKGLAAAKGDYICFLGADDRWAESCSLHELVRLTNGGACDIVAARGAVVSKAGVLIRAVGEPWSKARLNHRQIVAHPGMLFATRLFAIYGNFDTRYRVAGDYEWLMRLGSDVKGAFLDRVTVMIGAGGISERRLSRALIETREIQKKHGNSSWIVRDIRLLVYASRILVGRLLRWVKKRS